MSSRPRAGDRVRVMPDGSVLIVERATGHRGGFDRSLTGGDYDLTAEQLLVRADYVTRVDLARDKRALETQAELLRALETQAELLELQKRGTKKFHFPHPDHVAYIHTDFFRWSGVPGVGEYSLSIDVDLDHLLTGAIEAESPVERMFYSWRFDRDHHYHYHDIEHWLRAGPRPTWIDEQ